MHFNFNENRPDHSSLIFHGDEIDEAAWFIDAVQVLCPNWFSGEVEIEGEWTHDKRHAKVSGTVVNVNSWGYVRNIMLRRPNNERTVTIGGRNAIIEKIALIRMKAFLSEPESQRVIDDLHASPHAKGYRKRLLVQQLLIRRQQDVPQMLKTLLELSEEAVQSDPSPSQPYLLAALLPRLKSCSRLASKSAPNTKRLGKIFDNCLHLAESAEHDVWINMHVCEALQFGPANVLKGKTLERAERILKRCIQVDQDINVFTSACFSCQLLNNSGLANEARRNVGERIRMLRTRPTSTPWIDQLNKTLERLTVDSDEENLETYNLNQ